MFLDEVDGSLEFQSKDVDQWTKLDVGHWLVSRGLDEERNAFYGKLEATQFRFWLTLTFL